MWNLLIGFGVMVASSLMQLALTPKPNKPSPTKVKDNDFPQIEEGSSQLVVFGQRSTKSWQVLNYGNVTYKAIKQKSKGK